MLLDRRPENQQRRNTRAATVATTSHSRRLQPLPLHQIPEGALLGHQFVEGALLHDDTAAQNDDLVRPLDRGQPVGDAPRVICRVSRLVTMADWLTLSRADVASSRMRIWGRPASARASRMRCRSTDWIYCDNPWTNAYCTAKC